MSRFEIVFADEMGYCFGVRRAVEIIEAAAESGRRVASLGDIIHNPQAVARLEERGVEVLTELEDAVDRKAGGRLDMLAITAHGAAPHVAGGARTAGLEVIDTTCPLVTLVHERAAKLRDEGYFIIVFGDKNHPEVRGILGHAGEDAVAVTRFEDLPWQVRRDDFRAPRTAKPPKKVAILSQTTMDIHAFTAFVGHVNEIALPIGGEVFVHNTICKPTADRQLAVRGLADEVDLFVVVGGRKSANTRHLAEIGNELGVPSHHIQGPDDIDPAWFTERVRRVGLTAGASTPDDVIESVADRLRVIAEEPAPVAMG
ncbi:MAG: 4-hydroxy-3-methylbut-2-enyl diphosphate reductase [Chloroflexota bacterium]|nr:4-hydroxy-3-methylbut-2-enyl diphosphate reductase [Chloroflexota bacterium]